MRGTWDFPFTVEVLFRDWALVLSGIFGPVLSLSTNVFDSSGIGVDGVDSRVGIGGTFCGCDSTGPGVDGASCRGDTRRISCGYGGVAEAGV